MLQIKNTLVSLDIVEEFFACDLEACKGECCIEGDAGAPITPREYEQLQEVTPTVWDDLTPAAQKVLAQQGPGYYDPDGDLVTSIVDGRDCVFTTYAPGGLCLCAIDKACRGGCTRIQKPLSCALYPIRVTPLSNGIMALNYHRWKVCRPAVKNGTRTRTRVYEFLREPLERAFGKEWWEELHLTATEYLKTLGD